MAAGDLPTRQRGLRAAVQWSYGLLDEDARELFRVIAHFAGEVSLERLESVCDGDVLDPLAGLVDLSLVRRRRDGRFELPAALRICAADLLDQHHEAEALRRRHADAVIGELLPRAMRAKLEGRPAVEFADILALLDWSAGTDLERFAQLAAIAQTPLNQRGLLPRYLGPLRESLATGAARGRVGVIVGFAIYLACGEPQDLDGADFEGDAVFEGRLRATHAGKLMSDGAAGPALGADVAQRLATSPDPAAVRALAPAMTAFVHYAARDWDAAATAFDAVLAAPGGAWVQESALYMVGDCHLEAGRPDAACGPTATASTTRSTTTRRSTSPSRRRASPLHWSTSAAMRTRSRRSEPATSCSVRGHERVTACRPGAA